MVQPKKLVLIGYWDGPQTNHSWPAVENFVDTGWGADEREAVVSYLRTGMIVRLYMGYSKCRFCGKDNGYLELSDGHFVWPGGLAHYVAEHGVRLPKLFVEHAFAMTEALENADRDIDWWKEVNLTQGR